MEMFIATFLPNTANRKPPRRRVVRRGVALKETYVFVARSGLRHHAEKQEAKWWDSRSA